MIAILKSSRYQKERNKFIKGNSKVGKALIKTLIKFTADPNHPSLNLEKLGGTKVWSIRIDRSNRIFLYWVDTKTALFIDIGKHDKYRKY